MAGIGYADSRYSVEKILICPIVADLTSAGDVATFDFSENITITELGIILSTTVAGDTTAPVVAIKEGATELATLTVPDNSAAKDVVKTTTITYPNNINSGDTLTFNVKTAAADSGTAAGQGYIYIKYKERFYQAA